MSSSLCPKILKTAFLLLHNPFYKTTDGEYGKIWKPKVNFIPIFTKSVWNGSNRYAWFLFSGWHRSNTIKATAGIFGFLVFSLVELGFFLFRIIPRKTLSVCNYFLIGLSQVTSLKFIECEYAKWLWAGRLGKMTPRGPFKAQPFCDSVKEEDVMNALAAK